MFKQPARLCATAPHELRDYPHAVCEESSTTPKILQEAIVCFSGFK
jgi:hypothetical protein